jgi:hypothetical protein
LPLNWSHHGAVLRDALPAAIADGRADTEHGGDDQDAAGGMPGVPWIIGAADSTEGCLGMPSNRRYDAKRDKSEPAIVKALKAAGYDVWRKLAVDLCIRRPYWEPGVFLHLEAKTPSNKRNGHRIDKRQRTQIEFIAKTGVPRVTTPAAALEAARAVAHEGDAG